MDTQTPKEKLKVLVPVIAFVLALSLALNFIQYFRRNKATPSQLELSVSNSRIKKLNSDIQNAKNEINKYRGISVKLDEVIKDANLKIEQQEMKIRAIMYDRKLMEEENLNLTSGIDSLKERYLGVIDSMLIARKINNSLNNTIASMQDKIEELNTKLGYLQRLSTDNIIVTAQKKNVANNFNTTVLAKKTARLRICFDILPNPVKYSGPETIYVRIINPNNEVFSDTPGISGTFIHPEFKVEVPYTMSEAVNYKNEKMSVCVRWSETETYIPGLYIVELFTKDYKLGMITFTLK